MERRMMNLLRLVLAALMLTAGPVFAQGTYPSKQVRIVVPFPAGGSADILCRLVGEKLSATWGQPVIIDNRAGAGGNVGAEIVYRAEPDGYTLLCSPPGPLSINHNLYKALPYDWTRFVPIGVLALVPNVITARVDLPAGSLKEFIAYAKVNPGKATYASQGNGSTSHLSAQMLATMAGIELVHVPYKGEGPALVDLSAGRVDIFIGNIEFGDAAGDLSADESFKLGCVARAAATCGHEGANADVDAQAAFDDGGDSSRDGDFFSECALECGPVAGLRDAVTREIVVAFLVAAGDGDGEAVAGVDAVGVVREGRTGQYAFHLVADVENNLIGGERNDRALKLPGFGAMRVRALECRERVGE